MNERKDQFAAACNILGIDATALPVVDHLPKEDQTAIIAHYKLMKVIEAKNKINDGWKPDWSNYSQRKFYPWLLVQPKEDNTGFGLSYYGHGFTHTTTYIGSRLCLGSSEDCKTVFEQNKDLYEEYFLK